MSYLSVAYLLCLPTGVIYIEKWQEPGDILWMVVRRLKILIKSREPFGIQKDFFPKMSIFYNTKKTAVKLRI